MPEPPPPRPLKPGWRKAGRILLVSLGAVLAFVLLTVTLALVWLHTGPGAEELGRFVTNEARNAIDGDLRVHDIKVRGFLSVCVERPELRDPQNHKVFTAESLCVDLSPLALKGHVVRLNTVRIEKPWLEIATVPGPTPGTHTTTLAKAIAPRKKAQESKSESAGPFEWTIDVRDLQLRGGSIAMRPGIGEPATFALQDLDISQL